MSGGRNGRGVRPGTSRLSPQRIWHVAKDELKERQAETDRKIYTVKQVKVNENEKDS